MVQWFISLPSLTKRLCRLDAGSFCFHQYALLTANILWSKNWKQGTILDRTSGQNHRLQTPGEGMSLTTWPKNQSHSQIFRYSQSIFCLLHRPNYLDFFELCLHWVSVVCGQNASRWSEKPRVVQVYISDFERSQKNPISVQVNKDRRCHTVFILTIFWAKKLNFFGYFMDLKSISSLVQP